MTMPYEGSMEQPDPTEREAEKLAYKIGRLIRRECDEIYMRVHDRTVANNALFSAMGLVLPSALIAALSSIGVTCDEETEKKICQRSDEVLDGLFLELSGCSSCCYRNSEKSSAENIEEIEADASLEEIAGEAEKVISDFFPFMEEMRRKIKERTGSSNFANNVMLRVLSSVHQAHVVRIISMSYPTDQQAKVVDFIIERVRSSFNDLTYRLCSEMFKDGQVAMIEGGKDEEK